MVKTMIKKDPSCDKPEWSFHLNCKGFYIDWITLVPLVSYWYYCSFPACDGPASEHLIISTSQHLRCRSVANQQASSACCRSSLCSASPPSWRNIQCPTNMAGRGEYTHILFLPLYFLCSASLQLNLSQQNNTQSTLSHGLKAFHIHFIYYTTLAVTTGFIDG